MNYIGDFQKSMFPNASVAFEFTKETIEELDRLIERTGLASKTDLFNEAMSLMYYIVENIEITGKLPVIQFDNHSVQLCNTVFLNVQEKVKK